MIKFITKHIKIAKKTRLINGELARKKSKPNEFKITDYKIILYYVNNPNVQINEEHRYLEKSIVYYRELNAFLVEIYSKIINEKKFNLIRKFERIKPEIIGTELFNQINKLDICRRELISSKEDFKSIQDQIVKNKQAIKQQSNNKIKYQNLFYNQLSNKQLESECKSIENSCKRLDQELKINEINRDTYYNCEVNKLAKNYSRCMPIPKTIDEVFIDDMFILQDIYIISTYIEYPRLEIENQHEVYRLVINDYTNKMVTLDNKGNPDNNLLVPFIPKCILNKVYIDKL